ncbi:hypothetical protein [Streptomyces collinus]|uniref:hypothetical protein n=1 Tax=Streptomyces collinus TaxID=42684 RepID=UPI0029426D58|nr:hypothetical protein [Streptomyces collinus]
MNEAFVSGCLHGLRVSGLQAVLAPEPGECCVCLGPGGTEHDDAEHDDAEHDDAVRDDAVAQGR